MLRAITKFALKKKRNSWNTFCCKLEKISLYDFFSFFFGLLKKNNEKLPKPLKKYRKDYEMKPIKKDSV